MGEISLVGGPTIYASLITTDPYPRVRATVVDSSEGIGEVHLRLGHQACIFLSPAEAEQIVSALTAALQQMAVAA